MNKIKVIERDAFSGSVSVEEILLFDNELYKIEHFGSSFSSLQKFDLHSNPISNVNGSEQVEKNSLASRRLASYVCCVVQVYTFCSPQLPYVSSCENIFLS